MSNGEESVIGTKISRSTVFWICAPGDFSGRNGRLPAGVPGPAFCHADGIVDGVYQAQLVAGALSGQGEAGAVIHAGADDRKSQGHVDSFHGLPGLFVTVIDKAHSL